MNGLGIPLLYSLLPLYLIFWFFWGLQLTFLVVVTTLSLLYFFHIPPAADESKTRLFVRGRNDLVIAHRGGAYQAPENTLAAIRMAKDNGADGVELDIDFTKDGVAVLMHDASVDRTTNGTGLLSTMTYQEVATLDAAARHPLRSMFPLQRIPTLETAVALCLELDLLIFFDCKGYAEKGDITKQRHNEMADISHHR